MYAYRIGTDKKDKIAVSKVIEKSMHIRNEQGSIEYTKVLKAAIELAETPIPEREEFPIRYKVIPLLMENKSKRVQLLLQPSVHEAIRLLAVNEGISFNDYVNTLLRDHAERKGW